MATVTLTRFELVLAAGVGVRRRLESLFDKRPNRHGYKGRGWSDDIEGAAGEMAVAKHLGCYWDASVNTFKVPDVGALEVRTTSYDDGHLLVRPDDHNERWFCLVTGQCGRYEIRGAIRGIDAKQETWLESWGNGRPPAYAVPQAVLVPLSLLSPA